MNRYLLATILIAGSSATALAQSPISGATPPWTLPSPIGPTPPAPVAVADPFPPGSPSIIRLPAGKPLKGYLTTFGVYIGGDGYLPFDSGEYNLAGFSGNTRAHGNFEITLPIPANVDPINAPVPYKSCRNRSCGR
jgi:hypothetical protein